MKDYEIDIKEIKEILKKMQEDINRLENNFLYHGVDEYGPAVNNLHSTQAFNPGLFEYIGIEPQNI